MLKFLKELPDKYLITLILLLIVISYLWTKDQFLQRIADTLVGSLVTLVVSRKALIEPTTVNAEIQNAGVSLGNGDSTNSKDAGNA